MGKHNVVIAILPHGEYGISSAAGVAKVAAQLPQRKIALMVRIGSGAPTFEHDIRLGDVVISASRHCRGTLFQYDFGKAE
ncbi:hypothetical protein FOBRF1_006876 [Fusarium oxysporum]